MEPAPNPSEQPALTPPRRKAFPIFGKITLALICTLLIFFGGYVFGKQTKQTSPPAPSPSKEAMKQPTETVIPSPTITIIPSSKTKTVKAGLADSTAFKPYSIDVPDGWTDVHENTQTANIDKLTLTKNGYSLTIYQAALGGGGCLYKDDPPAEMAEKFTDFSGVTGKSGNFRRSWNQDGTPVKTIAYTVCQKSTTENSYGSITTFGRIDAISPNPADTTIINEIDGMIASLMKQ